MGNECCANTKPVIMELNVAFLEKYQKYCDQNQPRPIPNSHRTIQIPNVVGEQIDPNSVLREHLKDEFGKELKDIRVFHSDAKFSEKLSTIQAAVIQATHRILQNDMFDYRKKAASEA